MALAVYKRCIMYLRGAGAARIDLDGNACGEVSARDAEHAAEILASRQAGGCGRGGQGRGADRETEGGNGGIAGASSRKDAEGKARSAPSSVQSKVRMNSRPLPRVVVR